MASRNPWGWATSPSDRSREGADLLVEIRTDPSDLGLGDPGVRAVVERRDDPLRDYFLELTGKEDPVVLFLPTATGTTPVTS